MKKILHIVPQLEIIGGMERYIENFYQVFWEEHTISILNIDSWKSNLEKVSHIYSLQEKRNITLFGKLKKLFTRSKNIALFSQEKHIDISISHGEVANIFNILSKLFWNKAKIFITIHNTLGENTQEKHIYFISQFLYRFADTIISVSKELSQDIEKKIGRKDIVSIYNPFDFQEIYTLSSEGIEETLNKNEKIHFWHISRLEKDKNQEYLIDCFYEFHTAYPNSQLFIIGEWSQRSVLEKKIQERKLSEDVFFLWNQKNVYKYIAKMDYFLFTGKQEWFWRVLIDALAVWIPVLTHDYKYWAKEILRNNWDFSQCKDIEIHKNGILTPYMDRQKYIEAMWILVKTIFDKKTIRENTKKYNTENFKQSWNLLLK